ncbi:hypothetical protein SKZ59_05920 [Janthinobacterium sp. GMG2]|uniref:hypothetical protein n=1 Tax=Janthinobacterium sp. GMG2 TaxID=3096606 RepID=UPI0029F586FC|nr:hypothetical protein [Janthinobacterium sp. GMG2]MDX8121304.1 hypothetical protein [Janthinobacterium sp. GMG2]
MKSIKIDSARICIHPSCSAQAAKKMVVAFLLAGTPILSFAVGGGAPYRRSLDSPESPELIVFGTFFFLFLLMAGLRRISPQVFSKLTLGVFNENTEDITLARQLAETKQELSNLRDLVQGLTSDTYFWHEGRALPILRAENPPDEMTAGGSLEDRLDQIIAQKMMSEGKNSSLDDLLKLRKTVEMQETQREERVALNRMIDELMDNALRLRTKVFTMFAGVNLWLVFLAISGSLLYKSFLSESLQQGLKSVISDSIIQGVAGLYVSMAVFLVYVFRNTSSRISVLIALKEDQNHRHDVFIYLSKLRPSAAPSERDIEALKLLLQNHAERERGHEHPYELVLKGITNSTVLLKGGKVLSSKQKE